MTQTTRILSMLSQIKRLHDGMLRESCGEGLSLVEDNVISFLENNPDRDTAADIVELRGMSKGNVSQAVDKRVGKGMLGCVRDARDKRVMHLMILPGAREAAQAAARANSAFREEILRGVTPEEALLMEKVLEKISLNVKNALEKRKME